MTTYTLIRHNDNIYEFAIEDNRLIRFINYYEDGTNRPTEIPISNVPDEVQTKLFKKLCQPSTTDISQSYSI